MSFKLNGRELVEALTGLQRAMARKTNLAVLKHVRFYCDDQTVTATVTDLDHQAEYRFNDSEIHSPATLLLPAKDLHRLVKAAKDDLVTFEATDNPQTVRIGLNGALGERTHFLPCMEAEEWPEAPERISVRIADDRFITAYRSLIPFASTDPSRTVLNGIALQLGRGGHTLTATDGRRLCSFSDFEFTEETVGILPILNLLTWTRFPESCSLGTHNGQYRIESGNWTLQGKLVDGTYPNWKQVIPDAKEEDCVFQLADEDLPAVRQAVQTLPASHTESGGDKNAAVCLKKQDGVAMLAACDARGNWVNQPLRHSTISGSEFTAFNRSFFLQAVEAGFNRWQFADHMAPLRAETESGIHVLMPVRVESVPGNVKSSHASGPSEHPANSEPENEPLTKEPNMSDQTKPNLSVLPAQAKDQPSPADPLEELIEKSQTAREQIKELNVTLREIITLARAQKKQDRGIRTELHNARGVLEKLRDIAA